MHYFTPKKGVKLSSDREVELIEIQRAATRIELLVMEIISSSTKQVHVTYNARKRMTQLNSY